MDTAARRAGRLTESAATESAAPAVADRLRQSAAALAIDLGDAPEGRMDALSDTLAATLTSVQDAAGACAEAVRASAASEEEDPQRMATARMTLVSLDELQRTASRILDAFGEQITERREVVWLDRPPDDTRRPLTLRVAPLEVGRVLRSRLFGERTVALTSATLALGGSFAPLAIQWGSACPGTIDPPRPPRSWGDHPPRPPLGGTSGPPGRWTPLGDKSPLGPGAPRVEGDRRRVAVRPPAQWHLVRGPPSAAAGPRPDARGVPERTGGAHRRGGRPHPRLVLLHASGQQAAGALRDRISQPLLCQGDDVTAQLVRQFAEDEPTCLFGTLSLWQGVDVPGNSLQLVVIDRIPFPRPDDPLASARQRAVAARGGNGFMTVAASQAALLLAQAPGRRGR